MTLTAGRLAIDGGTPVRAERLPLHRPWFDTREERAVCEVLASFTFVATANAVMKAGARPVFADIDPATLGLDPADVARRITPKTRAILPMHDAGMACDADCDDVVTACGRVFERMAAHA